jgi:hypothetical protein
MKFGKTTDKASSFFLFAVRNFLSLLSTLDKEELRVRYWQFLFIYLCLLTERLVGGDVKGSGDVQEVNFLI